MLNLNIGILGHVDSGKTSIAKALSSNASTAAFDKNPQSLARGITLDLGFSSFYIPIPHHLKADLSNTEIVQLTVVDCPGHASLIRTVIGGAQIIDLVLLVIDVTKGIQTQTAECLVIAEIASKNLIVVLNKIDLLDSITRPQLIEKTKKKLQRTLATTKFVKSPMVAISSNPGEDKEPIGLQELVDQISLSLYIPHRNTSDSFLFAVDHCFGLKGKGSILTGTILQGTVAIDDEIELPSILTRKKVKSMQMFKQPVNVASAGDRLGICVTQFDPKLIERGIACAPGLYSFIYCCVISAKRIKYFRSDIHTKSKFHITLGYQTTIATVTNFKRIKSDSVNKSFSLEEDYEYSECLNEDSDVNENEFLLLEFSKPILSSLNCMVVGSKLDMNVNRGECRLAFSGKVLIQCTEKNYVTTFLAKLKIFKNKSKTGILERIVNENYVIVKNMFKKETNLEVFKGLKIICSTGEIGIIESAFGQSGKVRIFIIDRLQSSTMEILNLKNNNNKKIPLITVSLNFKRYIFDPNKVIAQ